MKKLLILLIFPFSIVACATTYMQSTQDDSLLTNQKFVEAPMEQPVTRDQSPDPNAPRKTRHLRQDERHGEDHSELFRRPGHSR